MTSYHLPIVRRIDSLIAIERYEPRIEHGRIKTYAIAGKKEYPMPDAFTNMYDDEHLAIKLARSERPEMFGIETSEYYIPLRTSDAGRDA